MSEEAERIIYYREVKRILDYYLAAMKVDIEIHCKSIGEE